MGKNVTAIILASATVLASVVGLPRSTASQPRKQRRKARRRRQRNPGASTGTTGQSTTGASTPSPENAAEDRLRKIMQICPC